MAENISRMFSIYFSQVTDISTVSQKKKNNVSHFLTMSKIRILLRYCQLDFLSVYDDTT